MTIHERISSTLIPALSGAAFKVNTKRRFDIEELVNVGVVELLEKACPNWSDGYCVRVAKNRMIQFIIQSSSPVDIPWNTRSESAKQLRFIPHDLTADHDAGGTADFILSCIDLRQRFEALPIRARRYWDLWIEGYDTEEIATMEGVQQASVRSALARYSLGQRRHREVFKPHKFTDAFLEARRKQLSAYNTTRKKTAS